jgi:hypothetical protein
MIHHHFIDLKIINICEFIIFTNTKKNLHSNDYTFGFAEVSLSMNDAIKEADENMCKNKYRF